MQAGGPAFSAYQSTPQSIPNGGPFTKVSLGAEEFDTDNAFDSTTNYRFQPTLAGYYQIEGACMLQSSAANMILSIYKNGAEFKRGSVAGVGANAGQGGVVSTLVYLNGSTDYVEMFAYQSSGAAINTTGGAQYTYLQGFLARAA